MNIEEIIQRVLHGDSNAFEPIIHVYQQKLFSYCYFMLGNQQEAEDVVQEVFIKAYQNLHLYRYDNSFSAWLYKIAGNNCLTLLKRRKKWSLLLPKFWIHEAELNSEEPMWEQLESNAADMLESLRPEDRQIVILHVLEDYTLKEIAQILQLKAGTVRKRFERIRKDLKTKSIHWEGKMYEQTNRI